MGGPPKYKPEYCESLVEYFEAAAEAPARDLAPVETTQSDEKGGYQKREVRRICAELPTLQGYAATIGVSSQTLLAWCEKYPEFAEAYARAKDVQYRLLVDRGLTRQYDATAFTFVAKNVAGMRDRFDEPGQIGGGGPVIQLHVTLAGQARQDARVGISVRRAGEEKKLQSPIDNTTQ